MNKGFYWSISDILAKVHDRTQAKTPANKGTIGKYRLINTRAQKQHIGTSSNTVYKKIPKKKQKLGLRIKGDKANQDGFKLKGLIRNSLKTNDKKKQLLQ